MATASATSASPLSATTDTRFLGYWGTPSAWSMIGCTLSGEYYQESGRYFGCSTIYTGCVNALPTGISSRGVDYCTSGSTCLTQTLHSAYPTSSSESGQKIKPLCAPTGYNRIDLYRATTAPIASTSSLRVSSSASSFSASRTSSSAASSQTAAPPAPDPQPVNPGVIAGASIAGVALLLVIAFLIWFFGFHRRKQRQQQTETPYQQEAAWNQQPEYVSTTYEVDGSHGHAPPGGYAPVQQYPPETWKYGNTGQVSELPTDGYGRR